MPPPDDICSMCVVLCIAYQRSFVWCVAMLCTTIWSVPDTLKLFRLLCVCRAIVARVSVVGTAWWCKQCGNLSESISVDYLKHCIGLGLSTAANSDLLTVQCPYTLWDLLLHMIWHLCHAPLQQLSWVRRKQSSPSFKWCWRCYSVWWSLDVDVCTLRLQHLCRTPRRLCQHVPLRH